MAVHHSRKELASLVVAWLWAVCINTSLASSFEYQVNLPGNQTTHHTPTQPFGRIETSVAINSIEQRSHQSNKKCEATLTSTQVHLFKEITVMCQYENISYNCGHHKLRLIKHCHFARNDPEHACFGAWNIKREWSLPYENCPDCVRNGQPQRVMSMKLDTEVPRFWNMLFALPSYPLIMTFCLLSCPIPLSFSNLIKLMPCHQSIKAYGSKVVYSGSFIWLNLSNDV